MFGWRFVASAVLFLSCFFCFLFSYSNWNNSGKMWPYGTPSCIPGAQACVLVFSTTDRDSFQAIDSWKEKVEAEVGDIPTVLVQNKIDLLEETVVKKWVHVSFCQKKHLKFNTKANSRQTLLSHCSEEAEALAKRLKLRFYRASVKEDLNVNEGKFL